MATSRLHFLTWYDLQYATNTTYEFIGYYGDETKDEEDLIEKTIDAIQENVRFTFHLRISHDIFYLSFSSSITERFLVPVAM